MDDIPIAGRIVLMRNIESQLKLYEGRTDPQGREIYAQLVRTRDILQGA